MVATRSRVCANSSSETNQKRQSSVQATPSTDRKTRRVAKQVEGRDQQTLEEPCSPLSVTLATSTNKRCTRGSRVHISELPSTPVGSVHEADTSDGGSVCSAVSTTAPPATRSMRRNRQPRAGNQENEEMSEAESCSFLVSASKSGLRSSSRRKTAPKSSDSTQAEVGDAKPDLVPEAESCSSATSESQRVAKSKRQPPRTRSSAKQQPVESEVSDTDSCASSIRGRVSRRKTCPIPIKLDELSESSQPPQAGPQTRSTRRKAAATVDVAAPPVSDSEGFESGPTYSLSTSRKDKLQSAGQKLEDSESEEMDGSSSVGSPSFSQGRGTPSSSRAGSGASSRGDPAPRRSARKRGGNAEKTVESAEKLSLLNDSRLESTMTADDGDCTLLEDQLPPSEGVKKTDDCSSEADAKAENKEGTNTDDDPQARCASVCAEQAGRASAMTSKDQEEALSAEDKVEDVSDVETMQETVSTLKTDTQPAAEDAAVQSTNTISLLDSSDDDDDDDDDELFSEGKEEERREGPSDTSAASVGGLFMIDKRPGQDADEQYYREEEEATNKTLHQEEEDEFVDEEEDEDDEGSKILSSCRSFQVKELSSRIDPGIRVKELGGLYISFDGSKSNPVSSSSQKLNEKKNLDEVMKKSVIGPDFEKKDAVPQCSERALKLKRRAERETSTGSGWFDMKAPELTQELKGDLKILKMRGSLDPKRFYKKNDRDGFPKYFQIGTVVDNPADFYHSHVPKKERKRTMVEELLADAEFRQKNKKRYQKIMAEKTAQGAGRRRRKKFQKK